MAARALPHVVTQPPINIGEFCSSFKKLAEHIPYPELDDVVCDISIEDVKIISHYEQVEQAIQQEMSKDLSSSTSFLEGGPVTQRDHDMSASVVSPGGHPQPMLAPISNSTANSTPASSASTSPATVPASSSSSRRRRGVQQASNEPTDTTQYDRVDSGDVLVSIAVYHNQKQQKTQEFIVLGSQPLTALRDRLYCLSDHTLEGLKTKSGYLFFENTFYNDMRDPDSVDYSTTVIEWAEECRNRNPDKGQPVYSAKSMVGTTFNDLAVRINAPYLYCHQGSCEHIIIVTDIRLLNKGDDQNRSVYPLQTFQAKIRRRKCRICDIYPAKFVTFGDKLAPENPCFFCDKCYQPLHYSADNMLLYQGYEVYPYYHE